MTRITIDLDEAELEYVEREMSTAARSAHLAAGGSIRAKLYDAAVNGNDIRPAAGVIHGVLIGATIWAATVAITWIVIL